MQQLTTQPADLNVLLSEVKGFGHLLPRLHVGKLVLCKLLLEVEQLFGREDSPRFLARGSSPLPSLETAPFGYCHSVGAVEGVVDCGWL